MRDVREVKAAGLGALVVGVYTLLVLATGLVPIAEFANLLGLYLKGSFALWLFFGFATILVVLYRNRPRDGVSGPNPLQVIRDAARDRWDRDRLVSLLWPPLLFAVLIAAFNAFKQMVLPVAGFHYDPLFAQMDRDLFLGTDPWKITHAVLGSPGATWFVDRAYHAWFIPMSVGVLACAWLPRSTYRIRNQYLLSYAAIWIGVGSVLAFLLPAAGPCYYPRFTNGAPDFNALNERLVALQAALGSELTSLPLQAGLLRVFGSDSLVAGAGISAMPSVHNALAVLFAIAAWRVNRPLGWVLAGYAVLIWIGSVHLGWHYAIDGVLAAALTFGIWFGAGRVAERFERGPAEMGARAALV